MSIRPLLAGSWTLVILALCWWPRSLMPAEESGPGGFSIPNLDKLIHLGIFAIFGFLWMRVGRPPGRWVKVLAAGLALAALSELVQNLPIVDRDAGLMDGVADAIGVGVGALGYHLLGRFRRPSTN